MPPWGHSSSLDCPMLPRSPFSKSLIGGFWKREHSSPGPGSGNLITIPSLIEPVTDQRQNDNQSVKELGIVPGQPGSNNAGLDKTDNECTDHGAGHGSNATPCGGSFYKEHRQHREQVTVT